MAVLSINTVIGITIVAGSLLSSSYSAPTPDEDLLTKLRLARSTEELIQLHTFNNTIKFCIRDITKSYAKMHLLKKKGGKLRWLNIKKLNKIGYSSLKEFHNVLEIFTIHIERLRSVKITTTSPVDWSERNAVYKKAAEGLHLAKTEFELMLHKRGILLPKSEGKISLPSETMDFSTVRMTDIQFFATIRDFLKNSKAKLQVLKRMHKRMKSFKAKKA